MLYMWEKGTFRKRLPIKKAKSTQKRKEINQENEDIKICICCKSEGHLAEECPWRKETNTQSQGEFGIRKETYQDRICQHCRALDHSVKDCPALKIAD